MGGISDFDSSDEQTQIKGGTDSTIIGNEGDALKVISTLSEQQLGIMQAQLLCMEQTNRLLKKIENQLNLITEFDHEQNYTEE